ncbi:DUF6508 domain-containing protein [Pleomorphovibrio marinus]|uniref:DUF6508 domain-containing protein n=1 Tax=Pleomorphovibrio marinus TaxID=2164132 RepID=UPI000E0C78B4|nr:DUF6508 domain-containing protein [Pleomorphovibrio marinus]
MAQEQTPLFIPLVSFTDHCKIISRGSLRPIFDLIQEMELKFYKAELNFGTINLKNLSLETLGFRGIHVRLLDSVLKLRLVPLFDWHSWLQEAEKYYNQPQNLYGLDTVTLGKIMTVLLRSQTIYDSKFLENKIKDKFVLHLLKAIVQSLQAEKFSNDQFAS